MPKLVKTILGSVYGVTALLLAVAGIFGSFIHSGGGKNVGTAESIVIFSFFLVFFVAGPAFIAWFMLLRKPDDGPGLRAALKQLNELNAQLAVIDPERGRMEVTAIRTELQLITTELAAAKRLLSTLNAEVASVMDFADTGFARRQFTYEDPASYQAAITACQDAQEGMVKGKQVATCALNWEVRGSAKEGERMIGGLMRLATRAFIGEADAAISRVTWRTLAACESRIKKAEDAIEKSLEKWGISISDTFVHLKLQELRLTFEHQEKVQEIKEQQRELREQEREEARSRREAEQAEKEAEREERRLQDAINKAKLELSTAHTADMTEMAAKVSVLESQLATAIAKAMRAKSMAEQTRRGNVYIISNVGSFGENVFKIGMTRRLDPMERIWELSDASVPFDFDVHGMIETDDAPALEFELHRHFQGRRLNMVNERKELFSVTIAEIQRLVANRGLDVKLTLAAEAKEYAQTMAMKTPVR